MTKEREADTAIGMKTSKKIGTETRAAEQATTIIGIAGGTGSGKSTFTNRLKRAFGDAITVIYHDNYYKPHDDLTLEERRTINYDHPDALDTDLLVHHLEELRAGRAVACPTYDFTQHTRAKETVT
nr:uridine kinase [Selenomonas sp.]